MTKRGGKITKNETTSRCEKCGHKCKERDYTSPTSILGTTIVVLLIIATAFALVYLGVQLERRDMASIFEPEQLTTVADIQYNERVYYYDLDQEPLESGSSLFSENDAQKGYAVLQTATDFNELIGLIGQNQKIEVEVEDGTIVSSVLPELIEDESFFNTGAVTAIGLEGVGLSGAHLNSVTRDEDYNLHVDVEAEYEAENQDKSGIIILISTVNIVPGNVKINLTKTEI